MISRANSSNNRPKHTQTGLPVLVPRISLRLVTQVPGFWDFGKMYPWLIIESRYGSSCAVAHLPPHPQRKIKRNPHSVSVSVSLVIAAVASSRESVGGEV